MLAIHPVVLPLDRERAAIADLVERAHDLLEVDRAAAGRAEVPPAAAVAEREVSAEDAGLARPVRPPHVLDMDVDDPLALAVEEPHVVDALIAEVTGIVVEAEGAMTTHGVDGALGGGE